MKNLIIIMSLVFSSLTFSQARSLKELSQSTDQLIKNYGDRLDSVDQAQIRLQLRLVQNVFRRAGYEARRSYKLICTDNAELMDMRSYKVLYKFTFSSTCKEALINAERGLNFCGDDEELVDPSIGIIYDFTFSSDCKKAVQNVNQYQRFCGNDADLRDQEGALIHKFTFDSECEKAMRR